MHFALPGLVRSFRNATAASAVGAASVMALPPSTVATGAWTADSSHTVVAAAVGDHNSAGSQESTA
jgi:polyisoprenoid-binding protein YceI